MDHGVERINMRWPYLVVQLRCDLMAVMLGMTTFSDVCLWSNRTGAGWRSSCGSSTFPGVLILPLMSTGRWGWLALNSIIAFRLHLPLLFSSVAHPPLSFYVHTRRHSLFKVWEEIQKLPLLVLRLVGLLLAGLSSAPQMKQSMQGTAATTDRSNVVKDTGAK